MEKSVASNAPTLANPSQSIPSGDVFERVQAELDAQRAFIPDYRKALDAKWEKNTAHEPTRFIDANGKIRREALENFRRKQIFVPETPATDYKRFNLRNILDGARRGEKQMLIDCYERLERLGHLPILQKYPTSLAGNPYVFEWKGTRFTYRWHKQMHYIGLVNRFLRNRLAPDFVGLDLGSSYGIFPMLVDFPEQLLLAYYFLATYLPNARIAGTREIRDQQTITREFIQSYDFVLVPVTMYARIAPKAVNLFSNFASLGEMRREWFKGYIDSPVFQTSDYFFCANRYESAPTYDSDLTVLDYPIWDAQKKIHFTTCPVFSHIYPRRNLFFNEKYSYPQYFEYIGRI
jgi:putative sugar O-methyltransferase